MKEQEVLSIAEAMEGLGIPSTMFGFLQAQKLGLITEAERRACHRAMFARGTPQDWWRPLVGRR
ncbi:hypothetical protein KKG24_04280 [Patescibacteria group bacterium]|nr:hypothetical protein [Patescibacteria group bacterium]